jgi:hypothetical protein
MAETVYDAVLGALTLTQVMNSDYSLNGTPIDGTQSGAPDVSEYFGGEADPQATFDTADVAGVLGGLTVTGGLHVSSGTITIPWAKRTSGGTFAGAGTNNRINGTNALIIPTGFRCNQGDAAAMASLMVYFRSTDGLTAPVTVSTDQNIASQTFNAMFGLGAGSINGTAIPELVGVAINPGITVIPQRVNGGIYPSAFFISQRRPTIDFIFEDLDALSTYSALFTVMTAAVARFRKRSGVSYVAAATEQHISFSFADGIVTTETVRASGVDNAQATLRCYGETLTVDTTAAAS